MPDPNGLIATLENDLERTKNALKRRLEYRAELEKNSVTQGEELAEVEAEIAVLKNSAEQSELVISSLMKRFQSGRFDDFGLDSEKR